MHKVDRQSLRVCRTCLTPYELVPLFPDSGHYGNFQRAIRASTGLPIEPRDGLPQMICRDCAHIIENITSFRKHCRAAQRRLLRAPSTDESHKSGNTEESGNEFADSEPEIITVQLEPMFGRDSEPSDQESCLPADEKPREITKVRKGKLKVISKRFLDLIEGPFDRYGPIKCKICKKWLVTLQAFRNHTKTHTSRNILCEICANSFVSGYNYLKHMRAQHGLAREQACPHCPFLAIGKEQLEAHVAREHTKLRAHVCELCGAGFYTKRVLKTHYISKHTEGKPHKCELCPSRFKLRSMLTGHFNLVHTRRYVRRYTCNLCKRTFKNAARTREHLGTVHSIPEEERPKLVVIVKKDP